MTLAAAATACAIAALVLGSSAILAQADKTCWWQMCKWRPLWPVAESDI
jgi:hypothetical protein